MATQRHIPSLEVVHQHRVVLKLSDRQAVLCHVAQQQKDEVDHAHLAVKAALQEIYPVSALLIFKLWVLFKSLP